MVVKKKKKTSKDGMVNLDELIEVAKNNYDESRIRYEDFDNVEDMEEMNMWDHVIAFLEDYL